MLFTSVMVGDEEPFDKAKRRDVVGTMVKAPAGLNELCAGGVFTYYLRFGPLLATSKDDTSKTRAGEKEVLSTLTQT